ncbi:MAG TPA: TonB family protein [Allosphingosinicella sp.]|jgi:protein TonB
MAATGFLEQKPASPLSFGAVLLLHGAAIAGVLLIKNQTWRADPVGPLDTYAVPKDDPPPPIPDEPRPLEKQILQPPTRSVLDVPPRVIPTPVPNATAEPSSVVSTLIEGTAINPPSGSGTRPEPQLIVPPRRETPPAVRVEAQWDPRFAGAMQPPYPPSEQRQEREGQVRVRVTIGPDGRVIAADKVSATSDDFWRVTQRQALSRWRFRPATLDGRPVQSSKTLTVHFRLDGR